MKKGIILIVMLCSMNILTAQNVGIGTTEPYNKLQVQGGLLVMAPLASPVTPPTAAQIKTMPVLSTVTFLNTDSTGRIYDPGGPSGNYGLDLYSYAAIPSSTGCSGIEITAETMDLNTGDSLIIKTSSAGTVLLAVGNIYNNTGKWVFNSPSLHITFKSNVDFNTGAGFSLLFKRLYDNSISLPAISGYAGNAFFFDAKKGALRSGNLNNNVVGVNSVSTGFETTASGTYSTAMGSITYASGTSATAMGIRATASGDNSTAMGSQTIASGDNSTAMGSETRAGGNIATAMGNSTNASGDNSTAMGTLTWAGGINSTAMGGGTTASAANSTAMGYFTTASGLHSTAMGSNTTASGNYSTAIGSYVNTNNKEGTLVIGDHSTTTSLNSGLTNFFYARFAGGYAFYTSSDLTSVCILAPGSNAWSTSSDIRLKENFENINGEDFLKKIAAMRLVSWNYKKQDPAQFRHYGPMAQEFYAAFGKDKYGNIGNDTTINQADFDGVNLIAIQALEKRTQKIEQLQKENEELKQILLQIRNELDELKKKNNDPL